MLIFVVRYEEGKRQTKRKYTRRPNEINVELFPILQYFETAVFILDFCKVTMKLEKSDQIQMSDVHRIGRKGETIRPYVHRKLVRKKAKTLQSLSFEYRSSY